ncbi:NuA4 histone H4 acetyltransferase complex and the SWR1 complex subunit [Ascosphaera aggregata]|nr:NuA4 histone H4 acetyltransferase complex and the SWR1 complex subunit [Ascosphaera aggregata]
MPSNTATKRVKGIQVFRPFVFGTEAQPFGPDDRPPGIPEDHTHKWRIFVRGVDGADISYWLKKVQFKLHETYAQCVRTIESPPFEVNETGWGEFEIQIKLYFVPESMEKPQALWHTLTLHPYGDDIEGKKERREVVKSINYEEVVFNEPVEQFYDILTGGLGPNAQANTTGAGTAASNSSTGGGGNKVKNSGKASSGSTKQSQQQSQQHGDAANTGAAAAAGRTAEIPHSDSPTNPYSQKTEARELDRISVAIKNVTQMIKEEKLKLAEREAKLEELKKREGVIGPIKKK